MKHNGLGELKQFLPHNYCEILMEQTGYSRNYIYKVATGKLTNWVMFEQLQNMANENKKIHDDLINTIKKIKK